MSRKLINIIIVFIMIQGAFAITSYCEANYDKASFNVSSATAKVGDEVSINVDLKSDSDFVSANLVLMYDTNVLEYVSYKEGKVLQDGAMKIVKNNSEEGKIAIGYVSNPSDEEQIVQSGNILSIVFKVKNDFDKKTDLELECVSLKDKDGADKESVIENGTIEKFVNENEDPDEDKGAEDEEDNKTENEDNKKPDGEENKKPDSETDDKKEENNDNKNNTLNDSQAQTNIPHTGLSNTGIFVIIGLILIIINVIIYMKNRYMGEL